jgi:signal transduction histidine kinase
MPESQRVRLLEIEKRRLLVDNLVKSKRIGILEAAKKRAELINQEDSIRLLQKDKIIKLLKKDTTDKAETITTLSKEKEEIEAEKNRRLWWLIGLALLALLIVLFLLYRKRQIKKKAAKEIELHKNKSVNQINSQRREINEQKSALLKQTEELNTTKIKLEEVNKEKDGLNKILQEDIAPPARTVVDLLKPDANENINRAMVYQSGVQIMNLLDNVEQVQADSNATVVLHKENHSIYKVSRSALDKVADLVTAKGLEVDNQIKPFFYATFDYEVVERIFLNFFANALKYTPDGGKVSLNAQPVAQDDKDVLEITFRDSGAAVPEDKLHRVFDNFPPEVARPAGSTWAFNKKMIEAHGGKVEVLPADEGLHVTFTLLDAKSLEDVDYNDLLGVKSNSPETAEVDIDLVEFSSEEKDIMKPFMVEFAQLEYYETSALKAVLNRIDPQGNSNLTKWKKALEQAILYLDEESYTKLTQL